MLFGGKKTSSIESKGGIPQWAGQCRAVVEHLNNFSLRNIYPNVGLFSAISLLSSTISGLHHRTLAKILFFSCDGVPKFSSKKYSFF